MDPTADSHSTSHLKRTASETKPERSRDPSSAVPPYWQHQRFESYSSVGHLRTTPIRLEDNTEECLGESSPLWAKGVSIDDHVLVSGNIPSIGDYVVWSCCIKMIDVSF